MEKSKPTTLEPRANSTWERLEDFVRDHVQQFIQALLNKIHIRWKVLRFYELRIG